MKSSQRHYANVAYENIWALQEQYKDSKDKKILQQYGQLCHRFPALVLTNGLRLAVAFFQSKGEEERNKAFLLFLEHIGLAVGQGFTKKSENSLPEGAEYLLLSRQVLSASTWFKRYAEAILNVTQGDEAHDDGDATDFRSPKGVGI